MINRPELNFSRAFSREYKFGTLTVSLARRVNYLAFPSLSLGKSCSAEAEYAGNQGYESDVRFTRQFIAREILVADGRQRQRAAKK
jgi:hypothetical protein